MVGAERIPSQSQCDLLSQSVAHNDHVSNPDVNTDALAYWATQPGASSRRRQASSRGLAWDSIT